MSTLRLIRLLIPPALVIVAAGCSAKPTLRDISGRPPFAEFEGIPTRILARQQVEVFSKQPDGTYAKVHEQVENLPDQSRLFATGIDADWLADHKLVLSVNPDGTLKQVDVTITSKAEAALTQLGTSASGVATAAASLEAKRDEMRLGEKKKLEDEQKARADKLATQEQLLLAYREALEAVFKQEATLANPDLKPDVRVVAESDLRIQKLKANQGARQLGRPAPYPDADQLP